MIEEPGQDGPDEERLEAVLARARRLGVLPLLCEVLADPSTPAGVRTRVVTLLVAKIHDQDR
jgi:hypothetical protein